MWLALLLVLIGVFYVWATFTYDHFKKRGIPYHKPFPMFGSMKDVIFQKTSLAGLVLELYNMHDGKVFGLFDQRVPICMIRDPELVKQIAIKDFDHFTNHRPQFNDEFAGSLFSKSVFAMRDSTWKDMRSTLSPAFTSSKMRSMYELINQVAQGTVASLKEMCAANATNALEIELKDFATRFTNDVIASTAFGLQVNSLKDPNNEFYLMGKRITTFSKWQNMKFFLMSNFKPVMKFLNMELFSKKDTNYFMRLVLDAMKYRKEKDISRPDMINMMMEARGMIKSDNIKHHNREWSDVETVAQCFIFFFAGFETASVLLCFTAHELMENADLQQRLYEEIEEVDRNLEGKPVTYEALQNMTYMDMVISEVLRKWPPAVFIDRECSKDFVYDKDGEHFEIKKGENLWIPVWGFHHDPKYFPEPNKFDPERFNEENKDKIDPVIYIPFGLGPRNCIGSRFALLEAKAFIYYLLRDFQIVAAKKTRIPIELSITTFQLTAKDGFWLKFLPRTKL